MPRGERMPVATAGVVPAWSRGMVPSTLSRRSLPASATVVAARDRACRRGRISTRPRPARPRCAPVSSRIARSASVPRSSRYRASLNTAPDDDGAVWMTKDEMRPREIRIDGDRQHAVAAAVLVRIQRQRVCRLLIAPSRSMTRTRPMRSAMNRRPSGVNAASIGSSRPLMSFSVRSSMPSAVVSTCPLSHSTAAGRRGGCDDGDAKRRRLARSRATPPSSTNEGRELERVSAGRHRRQPAAAREAGGGGGCAARDFGDLAARAVDVDGVPERRELGRVRGLLIPADPFAAGDGFSASGTRRRGRRRRTAAAASGDGDKGNECPKNEVAHSRPIIAPRAPPVRYDVPVRALHYPAVAALIVTAAVDRRQGRRAVAAHARACTSRV